MEAAALARVKHPLVVRFLDFGFDPRWPYLVTEFFEGRPLGELLRDGGALPPEWALYLISQMADALGAVWQAGLVHRDIKPDNILVGPNGNAKLIDFGLAKADALEAARERTGPELAGTAAYLAPEQAKDASLVDHRADIYSLGVTLYEALTGRLAVRGPESRAGDFPTPEHAAGTTRAARGRDSTTALRHVLVDAGEESRRPAAELRGTAARAQHRHRCIAISEAGILPGRFCCSLPPQACTLSGVPYPYRESFMSLRFTRAPVAAALVMSLGIVAIPACKKPKPTQPAAPGTSPVAGPTAPCLVREAREAAATPPRRAALCSVVV